ncbi:hypothetical protein L484_022995 [Morus notabilis]|uniref:5'-nucleotidase domain-containing protein n=1 Tax=Morus notabilis TaxID=981085 RepID=W9RT85_9ROSA|nr:hypothetical protein L484_022995 [Morus notabilis]
MKPDTKSGHDSRSLKFDGNRDPLLSKARTLANWDLNWIVSISCIRDVLITHPLNTFDINNLPFFPEYLVNVLSRKEIEDIYGTRHIGRDQVRGLVGLMDFFCFSEACLIADIVQHFVDAKLDFDACYVYQDVNRAIQYVHQSGLVHRGILNDPYRYLVKNDQLLHFLKMLKEKGKKLFLLTNSPYYFVDGGMRFLLEDSLGDRDSWRELFDVVIAQANKPDFYTSEHPFRCYDSEKDTLTFTKVDRFLSDQIYYHGCLKSFLEITKWNGPEVIYFGDHLFSDLRGPSKAGWRTAAIIHELEDEIRTQNEDAYRHEQARFHIIQELLGKLHATATSTVPSKEYKLLLEELNEERRKARQKLKEMFNKSFGATFVTDTGSIELVQKLLIIILLEESVSAAMFIMFCMLSNNRRIGFLSSLCFQVPPQQGGLALSLFPRGGFGLCGAMHLCLTMSSMVDDGGWLQVVLARRLVFLSGLLLLAESDAVLSPFLGGGCLVNGVLVGLSLVISEVVSPRFRSLFCIFVVACYIVVTVSVNVSYPLYVICLYWWNRYLSRVNLVL